MTDRPTLVLDAEITPIPELLRGAWNRRDLLPLLARQDFQGRFRASRLGLMWSVIQPLVRGAVLAIVFTVFVPIESDPVPYPVFVLAGSATWGFLSGTLTAGSGAIAGSSSLAGQVYFPRLLLVAMPAAANLPGFALTLAVVAGLMPVFGVAPSLTLLLLPLAMALGVALVCAMVGVIALWHVYNRDVGHFVSAGVAIVFYATPVIYPAELVGRWSWLMDMNPLAGAVAAVRWSLFGGEEALLRPIAWTIAWTLTFAWVTLVGFRRYDRICVDRL